MIGSLGRRGLGSDAPFSHVGEKVETNASDVAIQAKKSRASAEMTRLRQIGDTQRARLAAGPSSTWSAWAPLFIVGGVAAAAFLAAALRKKRRA